MMKQKSDALIIVPRFFQLVETQFGKVIKCFRSDNAPELAFVEFFHSKGVIHQFSCVGRPEQNSFVERKHQHLLNVACSLYFQSRVPIQFWGECVLAASFLINRTPSPLLDWTTPYARLYGTPVDYSGLKVFGCLCFASTSPHHRSKFHPRAIISVFLGYPPGMKGYRLFDIENKRFFVSRDVVFHENVFPFHTVHMDDVLSDPFHDIVLPSLATVLPSYGSQPSISSDTAIPHLDNRSDITTNGTPDVHDVVDTTGANVVDSSLNDHVASEGLTNVVSPAVTNSHADVPVVLNDDDHIGPSNIEDLAVLVDFGNCPTVIDPPPSASVLRRSTRQCCPPSYLRDYHCGLLYGSDVGVYHGSSVKFPIHKYLAYDKLSSSYRNFALNISLHDEPKFYHQAVASSHWREAMATELQAMEVNKTWSVVPLPTGHHSIGCKWVYKVKHNSDGTIDRYKARLVAKGYTQQEGLDYIETFSPVAKMVTVKVLLTLAVSFN